MIIRSRFGSWSWSRSCNFWTTKSKTRVTAFFPDILAQFFLLDRAAIAIFVTFRAEVGTFYWTPRGVYFFLGGGGHQKPNLRLFGHLFGIQSRSLYFFVTFNHFFCPECKPLLCSGFFLDKFWVNSGSSDRSFDLVHNTDPTSTKKPRSGQIRICNPA